VNEAATRGVFAYIVDGDADELQSAITITLRRFAEYHNLQGAFSRRARIEQAKGILMARHAINEDGAFEMLRHHSQTSGRKLVDIAEAVVDKPPPTDAPSAGTGAPNVGGGAHLLPLPAVAIELPPSSSCSCRSAFRNQ
jgi:ANTAR domain